MKTAVLLITFNRPATTKRVLQAIADVQPKKLYVFSDAPRKGNSDDITKVNETRALFENLNWQVTLKTNFRENNMGCGRGVVEAINWIFENEGRAIILEDDCLPNMCFFNYCNFMLDRYENEEKVMHIAGTRWSPEFKTNDSYLFSSIGHVWGWATWKRAWKKNDFDMENWQKNISKIKKAMEKPVAVQFWKELFSSIKNSPVKFTWDYQWQYSLFKAGGLTIVPNVNMISNIGMQGTHINITEELTPSQKFVFNRPLEDWKYISSPPVNLQNKVYDIYHMKNHFLKSLKWYSIIKKYVKYYFD